MTGYEKTDNAYHAIMLVLMLEAVPGNNPEKIQLTPMSRRQLIDAAAGMRGVSSRVIRNDIINAIMISNEREDAPVCNICWCDRCS